MQAGKLFPFIGIILFLTNPPCLVGISEHWPDVIPLAQRASRRKD